MKILVVDDKESLRDMIRESLRELGHEVVSVADARAAVESTTRTSFDVVLTDMRMPGRTGLDLVKDLRKADKDAVLVVMTAFGTVENAVEAMKAGAADYLSKPFSIDQLALALEKASRQRRLEDENRALRDAAFPAPLSRSLLGDSQSLKTMKDLIARVAPTDASVLITGESGVGKELVAREIHAGSQRSRGPYLKVSCAALAEGVLESELFGHERGSFTGALSRRLGRFELASGGTLFLDEVGDLPPSVQVKLLRVLQEKEIERVGGTKPIPVDVRIVAATHRNLDKEVREGRFREDLYFRLKVVPIPVPPLRDRKGDIPLLASYFLEKYSAACGRKGMRIGPGALNALSAHPWPGNVRELEHALERAVALALNSELTELDFESELTGEAESGPPAGQPLRSSLEALERSLIARAITTAEGNKTQAASALGIPRTALLYKLRKLGLG